VMAIRNPDASPALMCPMTFYPGANSINGAAPVLVSAGQPREGIDFRIVPVPAVQLAGTVVGADVAPGTPVSLTGEGSEQFSSDPGVATTKTDRSGRFAFPLVPAGEYRLRARRTNAPARSTDATVVSTGSETVRVSTVESAPIQDLPDD